MAVLREVAVRKMWNSVTTFEDVTRVTEKNARREASGVRIRSRETRNERQHLTLGHTG